MQSRESTMDPHVSQLPAWTTITSWSILLHLYLHLLALTHADYCKAATAYQITSPIIFLYETQGIYQGFPGGSDGKESACNAGDQGSIPGLGRSPEEGNGNPLQHSCLENPMDRGACRATVHGVERVRCDWATFTLWYRILLFSVEQSW